MTSLPGGDPPDAVTLDIVARELAALGDRIHEQVAVARSLTAVTDWQSKAATAFHERSSEWAVDVARLAPLVEAARTAALDARERALARHAWEQTLARLSGAVA